jgi:hypothetical protein
MRKLSIFSASKSSYVELKTFSLDDDPFIIGMSVKIKDLGFSGLNFMLGIQLPALLDFVAQMKRCEETRTGSAQLAGKDVHHSVEKFILSIRNYDSIGHFRLDYQLKSKGEGIGHERVIYELSGACRLDSSCFAQIVADCEAFVTSTQRLVRRISRR